MSLQTAEAGHGTGTQDKAYNLVWYVEECLKHTQRLQNFAEEADRNGDSELAEFFRSAGTQTQKVASEAKMLLRDRLTS